jgi:hypothetical protein
MIDSTHIPPSHTVAGRSSLVAGKAHNLEVNGSNSLPATNFHSGCPRDAYIDTVNSWAAAAP